MADETLHDSLRLAATKLVLLKERQRQRSLNYMHPTDRDL